MDISEAEKEWLRRTRGAENNQEAMPAEQDAPKERKRGNGFRDIAGMGYLKEFVRDNLINVLNNKECAEAYGIKPPSLLLYGPSGCGKTFFAEKMAEELDINFMKVVPDDLACTWVHGTQEKIGKVFRKAEKKAPTLLFFDEFDAMVARRTGNEENQHYDSEVNEFLCMLNNASDRGVYVVAATNHPERIDRAVLRTGRIDELIYIDMPDLEARSSLFALALSKLPAEQDIDTMRLATLTKGYNCSDISYIVASAARKMFNASISDKAKGLLRIDQRLLEDIIAHRRPSVSSRDLREYERVRCELSPRDAGVRRATIGFK